MDKVDPGMLPSDQSGSEDERDGKEEKATEGLQQKNGDAVSTNVELPQHQFFCYKFVKQIVLLLLWIAMGIGFGIIGPVLPDLKDMFNSNYEELGRANAMVSIGHISGAFIGGIVHERWRKHTDMIMAISVLVLGILTAAVPWVPSVVVYVIINIVSGISFQVLNSGGVTMVLDLWGEKSASALFTLHLGFGIGAFLGPMVAKPFISAKIGELIFTNISGMNTTGNWWNETHIEDIMRPANLVFPFGITGAMDLLFVIIFALYYIRGLPKGMPFRDGTSSIKTLFNPGQCTAGNSAYGIIILILIFLFYLQAIGGEVVFGQFLYTFATESDVNFTSSQAATLTSTFYLCHLSGRALGAVLSKFLSINLIVTINIIGLIASTVFLAIFGYDSPLALWIGTGFIGLLCSFIYPAGTIWANLYMDVNSMVVMIMSIGGSAGFILYSSLGGYLIENISMRSLLYLEAAYAIILAVIYLMMFLLGRKYGHKTKTTENSYGHDGENADVVVELHIKQEDE